ncbi:histidine ammonia-lyase [Mycobacterium frederiksbergense]|uniref:Histidine ammonia-lyase n=1 Tax=Mycolicibacterium frederiksbergense TaxID=117567 RepID=A0ABT6L029_9MYCO|nr:aromatic amino acid lyase [Mycolicibacterium frederiksbergense]MDH6196301.1 histidine ammonia-lyase [Mycolicibacterium frederiksbergense]
MIVLSGTGTIADVVTLADRRDQVSISPDVLAAIGHAYHQATDLSRRFPTYGRTTGVGGNRGTQVHADDKHYGMRLLRSHAVDAGDPLADRIVRAMLAVRLIQLCVPGAGLDPRILSGLERMLNDDALPELLQYASIGTGDLAALAGTALTLIGERPATAPLTPMEPWSADSALPFMSSSALTVGRSCLALDELNRLERASSVIYLLSFLALDGNPSTFSPAAARAAAAPQVDTVAARLRRLLTDGAHADHTPARIQDPYGLRVYPVAHASVVASLDSLARQLERTLNTAQENPLFDFDGDGVVHHGAFYQASLSLELDGTTLALALTAPITHSRIRMLNDPDTNGRNAFLASSEDGSSGLMMVEYVAAGAIAEIRAAAQPASIGTLVLSRGAEEDATFASQATQQLERSVAAYRVLLGCELVGAVRLLRQRGLHGRWAGALGQAFTLASDLPWDDEDRDLRGDLDAAESLLDDLGRLVPDSDQVNR